MPPTPVASPAQYDALVAALPAGAVAALDFWAAWAPQCAHMNDVFAELAAKHPEVAFWTIDAEEVSDVSERFDVDEVPTFIVLKDGKVLARVTGADAAALSAAVAKHARAAPPPAAKPAPAAPAPAPAPAPFADASLEDRLRKLTTAHPVMLFMKGTPSHPRCGFSRQMVELLDKEGIKYGSFNILADEAVRQGLKSFSNWPTFPQLYISGELAGGLDVAREMAASGELRAMVPSTELVQQQEPLDVRLGKLVRRARVMLFMKGSPGNERCGFSRQIVGVLRGQGVEFDSFDILSDDEVRQGLKEYSKWPTYPQLYVDGELVGGLDVVREMAENGELKEVLAGGGQ